jgi:succinylglutamate desuccinylase
LVPHLNPSSDMSTNKQRMIGAFSQGNPGPLIFIIGSIHGNEPAGTLALKRVFEVLEQLNPDFRGKLVGVIGNLPALDQQRRYIDCDLNRLWSAAQIQRIRAIEDPAKLNTEERELLSLLSLIEAHFTNESELQVLIDLHTTSATGGLFSIVTEQFAFNHRLASALHAPVIFGLANSLSATTNVFMDERGIRGLAFESGQHTDPRSVDLHESAVWLILEKCGCISADAIPDFEVHHEQLIRASTHLPHYVEVVYRHAIGPQDAFHMHPGFTNFHEVYKGEPLARDRQGEVICPETGMILMPLYQTLGEEGFYVIQKIDEPPTHS